MEKSNEILQELAQVRNQLSVYIGKLVRVQHLMLDTVVCGICQQRRADSVCNCGLDICTTCEQKHKHTNLSQ